MPHPPLWSLIAIGTSLAVLLPPVGLAAAVEYYRHGHVNVYAAVVIAVAAGGWVGAVVANHIAAPYLRLAFAGFVLVLGVHLVIAAVRQPGVS